MTLDNLTDLAETTAMEICVTTNHDTSRMPQLARASGSRLAYACFRTSTTTPGGCSKLSMNSSTNSAATASKSHTILS